LSTINIKIKRLNENAILPEKQHDSDAGYDLHSIEEIILRPNKIYKIRTGIAIQIPNHYAGLVLPRSGLSSKYGISLINTPGLIDSGYRGELLIPLINHSSNEYTINKTERVAQLILIEIPEVKIEVTSDLDESDRESKGFGSTG
tara:strand:+ start:146 stop:580 length:435 start_codon:yes stop_codon:yes gene_type:complete